MNYIQWHIGDWISDTALLTPTERGVYFDLLMRYYKEERPIMQMECTRIARAYAPDEQNAMQYVLSQFFELKGDSYVHKRCEEEIARAHANIDKRKKAADARWSKQDKEKRATSEISSDANVNASAYANANANANANASAYANVNASAYANGMLTINHKPLTNKEKEITKENKPSSEFNSDSTDRLPCPYERIKGLFNESLPELPAITRMSDGRKKALRARWTEETTRLGITTQDAGIAHFKAFFERVKRSDFLTGRKTDWRADFDWLIKAANFLKTLEGKYDNSSNHHSNQYGPDCENDSYDFSEFGRVS
ncbi:MAG: YdaU family protein [Sutterella wadsworthensis]|nr:YdaU family protein [Sutterella wadsworthensis]